MKDKSIDPWFLWYSLPGYWPKNDTKYYNICKSYTMDCPPVRGDNPRALAAWRKRSLEWNCHWIVYGTGLQHSLALADLVEEKKAQAEQQQPKQPPLSTSKVSLDEFDQGVVRRTIHSMYSLKKVLPTLDNIRTEPKQSIGTVAARVVFAKISFIWSLLTHAVGWIKKCWWRDKV